MTSTSLEAPSFFVDLQVNGKWLGGVHADFSGPELSEAQACAIIEEALACGTVICPTTITQDTAQHCRNLGTISRALASVGMSGRWQHVEGPFFRATPALGAHPEEHVMAADISLLERMIEASGDTIALLTVGPDVKNICALIEYAVRKGIVVSLGHHMAAPTQVDEAKAAGATWLTHLYNGIPLQVERQGILDFELDSALGAMLICDGTHVKSYCLHLALCLKGVGSIITVSDQSALSGAPPTPLETSQPLWGKSVRVDRHPTLDTSIIIGENGMLAGSWANMLWCMNHMAALFAQWNARNEPWTVADLWQIGRENPLRVLGRTADQLAHLPLAKIAWQDGRFVRLGAGESA